MVGQQMELLSGKTGRRFPLAVVANMLMTEHE